MNDLRVIMLGDSLTYNGGIVTVENLIIKYISTDIKIQHISTHENGSHSHKAMIFVRGLIVLVWRLSTQKVDLVHIHLADWGSVVRKATIVLIALAFRKPIAIHAHGPEFHLTHEALPAIAKRLLSSIFRKCNKFIVLSESWKNFYVANLGLREGLVLVLPNPVEIPKQIPERSHRSHLTLVFLGRVGQRKGAFDLLQAFSGLSPEQKQQSKLIFAGDGDLEEGHRLVNQLGLSNAATFVGWLSSEQKNELLAEADIFILPSYNEALPMALLEAMSWGLPVITCPVGGIAEIVISGRNGLCVLPGEIPELTEALQTLITNQDLRLHLGEAARASVESLDVKQYVVQISNIYRSLG
jgi:glycosyltransferase involved in cell wall biosynthesis